MLDAVVVGAGPSGAHFAAQASKKGYTVTIIEKGQLGRAKCCAGGLSGRFLKAYSVGDRIEFYFNPKYSKAGYSWVFPKKQSVAIGLVTDPFSRQKTEALYGFIADYTSAHPTSTQRPPAKTSGIRFGCAMLPNAPVERMSGNHFMLLGDAAGLIDPTTWEGIYFAFKSADIALDAFERNYGKGDFSSEKLGIYQTNWKSKFGKELEHARSIQRRVYGERMGKLWKLIIHELNSDNKLRKLVTDELSKDMSIANMVEKIPLATKLRIAAKYSREH